MKKTVEKLKKVRPIYIIIFLFAILFLFFSYSYAMKIESEMDLTSSHPIINFFGIDIDIKTTSLFFSAVIIGLLDGFNPCAMWVLIYLISMVSTLKDRKKMVLIVGTFVITEAIMYFFVLAGWLNLFQFIGFSKWVLYIVGAIAVYMGINSIIEFVKTGGVATCPVGNGNTKKKTMSRIREIVESPITLASILATIVLAVIVNSFEFVCSAALPAIFTQMLAISQVSTFTKYFYIIVYDFFFMLDDFIIFALAYYAINSNLMDKYSGYSKLIGGVIMIVIGLMLLFFPNLLF